MNWRIADRVRRVSRPSVLLPGETWALTWPAICDTQYGSLRLIDATLSTLITATAAMRRQLINRLTMFVTSDRPRYLGDGPSPLPVHLFRVFFSTSHLLSLLLVILISLLFPKWHFVPFRWEFSLLTAWFQSPITLPSELIRTEARADVPRVGK